MNRILIAILFPAFVLYGCATSRIVTQSQSNSPTVVDKPMPEHKSNPEYPLSQEIIYEPESEVIMPAIAERLDISFSGIQCEHVRIKGVNPLPEGGLVISLDELAREFHYPYNGKLISDYGRRGKSTHTGIDIKAVPNDTIRAAFAGVVRMAKNYSGYGNLVVISHYCGFETLYAHGSKNLVKPNDIVEAGTPIALAGRTGRATTEHLHFEMRAAGEHIDPKILVDPQQRRLRTGWLYVSNGKGKVVATNLDQIQTHDQLFAQNISTDGTQTTAVTLSNSESGKAKSSVTQTKTEYYKVKKGDTLSGIASRYKTTAKKLSDLNGIKTTSLLQINQRLRVR